MPRGACGDQQMWQLAPGRWWPGWGSRTPPPPAAAPSRPAEEGEMLQPAEARGEEEFQEKESFTLTPDSQN